MFKNKLNHIFLTFFFVDLILLLVSLFKHADSNIDTILVLGMLFLLATFYRNIIFYIVGALSILYFALFINFFYFPNLEDGYIANICSKNFKIKIDDVIKSTEAKGLEFQFNELPGNFKKFLGVEQGGIFTGRECSIDSYDYLTFDISYEGEYITTKSVKVHIVYTAYRRQYPVEINKEFVTVDLNDAFKKEISENVRLYDTNINYIYTDFDYRYGNSKVFNNRQEEESNNYLIKLGENYKYNSGWYYFDNVNLSYCNYNFIEINGQTLRIELVDKGASAATCPNVKYKKDGRVYKYVE